MADVRFDQFVDGGEMQIGDIPVGLRVTDLANNYKFNFPGSGLKDSSGNYLFRYQTAGALAVNYPLLINVKQFLILHQLHNANKQFLVSVLFRHLVK